MNSRKILFFIFLSAIFLRFSNIFNQTIKGHILFFTGDSDAYCHLTRIQSAIENFPQLPVYEPFLNFPYGAHHFWPPVFDWLTAVLCLIMGLGSPSVKLIEWVCALFPPVIGAATIFPVYWFSKKFFLEENSLLAAAIFSLMPFHILYTTFARFDHHFIEPFFFIIIILFFIYSYEKSVIYAFLCGFFIFLSLGSWVGSIIFILILGFSVILQIILDTIKKKSSTKIFYSGIISLAVALPCAMLLKNPYWKKIYTVSFDAISIFQPYVIWFFLLLVLILYFIQSILIFNEWKKYIIFAGLAAAGTILYALFFSGGFVGGIFAGINFLGNKPPQYFRDFGEFESLISNSSGIYGIVFAMVILAVIVYGLGLFLKNNSKDFKIEHTIFLVSTVILGIMTLKRARFSGIFSINISIIIVYIFQHVLSKTEKRMKSLNGQMAAVLAVLVLCLYGHGISKSTDTGFKEYFKALLWLRENSPDVSRDKPEYGVLPSASEYGNAVVYVARRPSIATNMHLEPQGLATVKKFFNESDLKKAEKILDENKIKYIILSRTPYIEQKAAKDSMYNKLWQSESARGGSQLEEVYLSPSGNIKIFTRILQQQNPPKGLQG